MSSSSAEPQLISKPFESPANHIAGMTMLTASHETSHIHRL